ncbi:hypothetical protein [Paenibacillus tepidiphilus]|uniref:hypothetical protein n=1 Tax=Paenibacillus tepidiphilus TaxID=2608683 RepID=UPI0013A54F90|nr:hypothetical protein [Paenibacillus tepidiphilus]
MKITVLRGEEKQEALRELQAYGYKTKPANTMNKSKTKASNPLSFFGNRTERMNVQN